MRSLVWSRSLGLCRSLWDGQVRGHGSRRRKFGPRRSNIAAHMALIVSVGTFSGVLLLGTSSGVHRARRKRDRQRGAGLFAQGMLPPRRVWTARRRGQRLHGVVGAGAAVRLLARSVISPAMMMIASSASVQSEQSSSDASSSVQPDKAFSMRCSSLIPEGVRPSLASP